MAGHAEMSTSDPMGLHIGVQLAEMIGQLQRVIDLLEIAADPTPYDPIVIDLTTNGGGNTPWIVNLPAEAHQLAYIHLTTETTTTFKLYLIGPDANGPAGKLIGWFRVDAASAMGSGIALGVKVPAGGYQLQLVSSATIAGAGGAFIRLGRASQGGYPHA